MWQLKMNLLQPHPAIERYVVAIQQRESLKNNPALFAA